LFCCLFFAHAQNPTSTFSGTWTSSYDPSPLSQGQSFYICYDPISGRMEGLYSEVGFISGLVVNNSDGSQTFTGVYYEAGRDGPQDQSSTNSSIRFNPANGLIQLTMDPTGQSFSGVWAYTGGSLQSPNGQWSETRISSVRPADYQCFSNLEDTSQPVTLDGEWGYAAVASNTWDICITRSPSLSSYDLPKLGGIAGYTAGQCFLNDTTLCQYDWSQDQDVTAGIMLVRSAYSTLWTRKWNFPTIDSWHFDVTQLDNHNWSFVSGTPNACARYVYLQYLLKGSASATTLSILLLVAVVLFSLML